VTPLGEEFNISLSRAQANRLIAEPETELIIYYPNGARIIVRVADEFAVDENETVH